MEFRASAPGSVMLLGEYAVLENYDALVCAINRRIHVTLEPRLDNQIKIISALGTYQTNLSNIELVSPFQFILGVVRYHQLFLEYGCTLTVHSEFSHQVGLASSAAVTVATLAALRAWLNLPNSFDELIRIGRDIIQSVQGLGSGADVAACVLGGMVAFCQKPLTARKLPYSYPFTLIYSGSKTPTVTAVTQVKQAFLSYPELLNALLAAIGACSKAGIAAVDSANWTELGRMMAIQQAIMDALGVNTSILKKIIAELTNQPDIINAKISGSGLGDCVIGLGVVSDQYQSQFVGVERVDVGFEAEGVRFEKN